MTALVCVQEPRCGFSRRVSEVLSRHGIRFGAFDILQDMGVRDGLKRLSNWPTFPQVYVNGELLGGCDIVMQMEVSSSHSWANLPAWLHLPTAAAGSELSEEEAMG